MTNVLQSEEGPPGGGHVDTEAAAGVMGPPVRTQEPPGVGSGRAISAGAQPVARGTAPLREAEDRLRARIHLLTAN